MSTFVGDLSTVLAILAYPFLAADGGITSVTLEITTLLSLSRLANLIGTILNVWNQLRLVTWSVSGLTVWTVLGTDWFTKDQLYN